MKRIFVVIMFTAQLTISGCQADTFHYYKDEVAELTRDPKTRKIQGSENDLGNLSGCEFLSEMGKWESSEIKGYGKNYGRHQSWIKGTMYHGTGVALDLPTKRGYKNLNMILQDKSQDLIYIGPWHQSPRINKTIRFFAYYPKEGGEIQYQYESQTEENKNIPEKSFSLSPTAKYAPDNFGLCVVKWTARFGYNAVAEVEYKGFLNKIFRLAPTPTGKIIEAKE